MMTPRLAGSDLNTHSCQSPTASKVIPTSHTAKPTPPTASNGFGVGPVTAESCSGNETNNVRRPCNPKTLRNACTGVAPRSRSA